MTLEAEIGRIGFEAIVSVKLDGDRCGFRCQAIQARRFLGCFDEIAATILSIFVIEMVNFI